MVPEDWSRVPLGDLVNVKLGATPARKEPDYWATDGEEGFPWVSIGDLDRSSWISETAERITPNGVDNSSVKLVEPGRTLISFKLTLGKVARAEVPLYTNEAIAALEPLDSGVTDAFLYYSAPRAVQRSPLAAQAVKGVTLNKKKLQELMLLVPPVAEQKKIAAILSSVDDAIAATREVIDQTKRVKKGLLQTLMTRGIGHTRFKKTEIGEIPEEWDLTALGGVSAHVTKGGTPTTYGYDWAREEDGGVLFLRSECVSEDGFQLEGSDFIPEAAHEEMSRSEITGGDVLITITGNVGRVGQVPEHIATANINQHIARVRIESPELNKDFVHYALQSNQQRGRFESIVTGLAYPQLSLKQIRETVVPVPPLSEQETIVEQLGAIDAAAREEEETESAWRRLKRGLMQDLLTGRVRVQPD